MVHSKRKLHVIAIQEAYLNIAAYQLVDILGDKVDVLAITLQELTMDVIGEGDIVILSKEILKGITRPFIPASCPIIVAKREVNIAGTREFLSLPKNQQILVINDTLEHAEETAISLKNIHFEQEYIAYDPINPIPSQIDLIVTPGEKELVPKQFKNVIDIGPRTLDFNTVLEIASHLNDDDELNILMKRFFKSQLSLAEKLNEKYNFHYKKPSIQKREDMEDKDRTGDAVPLSEKEMSSMVKKIEEHGFLEESLAILAIYLEGKRKLESFGRTTVKQKLQHLGFDLSAQQLRLRLEVMQELGLVIARQGRGGTKLSETGEEFLSHYTKRTGAESIEKSM